MNEKAAEFLRSLGVPESDLAHVEELMQEEKDPFEQGFDEGGESMSETILDTVCACMEERMQAYQQANEERTTKIEQLTAELKVATEAKLQAAENGNSATYKKQAEQESFLSARLAAVQEQRISPLFASKEDASQAVREYNAAVAAHAAPLCAEIAEHLRAVQALGKALQEKEDSTFSVVVRMDHHASVYNAHVYPAETLGDVGECTVAALLADCERVCLSQPGREA